MIEKDNIQELLQEKLQSHEVTPPDAVWQNVSSSLSNVAATSGAAAGTSTLLEIGGVLCQTSSPSDPSLSTTSAVHTIMHSHSYAEFE